MVCSNIQLSLFAYFSHKKLKYAYEITIQSLFLCVPLSNLLIHESIFTKFGMNMIFTWTHLNGAFHKPFPAVHVNMSSIWGYTLTGDLPDINGNS
jgi:hypothetical protein